MNYITAFFIFLGILHGEILPASKSYTLSNTNGGGFCVYGEYYHSIAEGLIPTGLCGLVSEDVSEISFSIEFEPVPDIKVYLLNVSTSFFDENGEELAKYSSSRSIYKDDYNIFDKPEVVSENGIVRIKFGDYSFKDGLLTGDILAYFSNDLEKLSQEVKTSKALSALWKWDKQVVMLECKEKEAEKSE